MALFLGSRESDVLAWRGTSDLFAGLKRDLAEHAAFLVCNEHLDLLTLFNGMLTTEIAYEQESAAEFNRLLEELKQANESSAAAAVFNNLRQSLWHYFERRCSVVALQHRSVLVHDALLLKAVQLAAQDVKDVPIFCWFIAGPAGREEQGLRNRQRHFVVYRDGKAKSDPCRALCMRAAATLVKAQGFKGNEDLFLQQHVWYGSFEEWQQWLTLEIREKKHEHHSLLDVLPTLSGGIKQAVRNDLRIWETVATAYDLRLLAGDRSLAEEVLHAAHDALDHFLQSPAFDHLARIQTTLPVALNMFGWFRLERRGRHRGEFDMDHHVLDPLVTSVSLLSLKHRITARHTLDRVRELVNRGALNVELGEKIFRAYQEIQRRKILLQGLEDQADDSCFVNPESLSEPEWHALKHALETVVTAQKTINHEFTEMQ